MTRFARIALGATALSSFALPLFVPSLARAATYYVAPTGDDSDDGSESAPFATWAKAQSVVSPGDTVYFRGGHYRFTDATSDCGGDTSATVNAVVLSKSGTADQPIRYWAYPGERPVFDFSGITNMDKYNCRQAGVRVTASYLHLKGLELTGALQLNNLNHESWCVYVYGGSNNLFEQLDAHHNMGPGFFLQRGSNNTFLNCDSHENEDTLTSNGDGQSADGFGCHPNRAGDTGNVFRGCRAWWNTDDGWDFINAAEACTVEYSWAWYNGYKPDAVNNGSPVSLSSGNGNGFKGGGYGLPPSNVPAKVPTHVLRFNVSVANKAAGFYANHSPNSPIFYNNTAYKNAPNYNLLGVDSDGSTSISVGLLRNNLAFGGTATSNANLSGPIDDAYDSWDSALNLTVSNADFQSVTFTAPASCPAAYEPGGTVCVPPTDTSSFAGMASARGPDGSLPVLPFLHLAADSQLIDRGTDVDLPFVGAAPDLGAFEYGAAEGPMGGNAGQSGGAANSGGASGASTNAGAANGGRANGGASNNGGRANGGRSNAGGPNMTSGGAVGASGGTPPFGMGARAGANNGGSTPSSGGAPVSSPGGASGGPVNGGVPGNSSGGQGGRAATNSAGGSSASGGSAGTSEDSGCGCHVGRRRGPALSWVLLSLVGLGLRRRRRST
jgi:hypothetical protein